MSNNNSAFYGNDYEYFLKTIWPQKKKEKKEYFDIKVNDIEEIFEVGEEIGSGGYSSVHKVIHKKTKKAFAIKFIGMDVYKKHIIRMEAEASILGTVHHPAVVKFYGVVRTPEHFCLVMELLLGGELFERMINNARGFPEQKACAIITSILESISHLHECGVVHRDIKPENFLFEKHEDDINENEDGSIGLKLIDFGFATFLDPLNDVFGSSCGTPDYIAPELLLEDPHSFVSVFLCGSNKKYIEKKKKLK